MNNTAQANQPEKPSVIHVLPPDQAAKIAAGEVIERPAHVLKELIENAVDAGATTIAVHIDQTGKDLIRVVDNGCGMWPHDAYKAVLPHATSKLHTLDDLSVLQSFGFRGEALYSIAAISKLTINTRHQQAQAHEAGISLRYQGVNLEQEEPYAGQAGSDICVHDLFFNIPVRKKFLKTDSTEWNALLTIVHAHALASTHIWFKLYQNNNLVLNAPPVDDLSQRIAQLWGHQTASHLLTLQSPAENQDVQIQGRISDTQLWRYGKHQLFFFVNNRWIKNQELTKGLLKGYERLLPPDKFPAAFVFIQIDQSQIDINVHPKKEEVRFLKPLWMQNLLATAVKHTLEQSISQSQQPTVTTYANSSIATNIGLGQGDQQAPTQAPILWQEAAPKSSAALTGFNAVLDEIFGTKPLSLTPHMPEQNFWKNRATSPLKIDQPQEQSKIAILQDSTIIGQLFATYIVVQKQNCVQIIDQHAAHERILYQRYCKNFESMPSVELLFGIAIELSPHECQLVAQHAELFSALGIGLRQLSSTHLMVHAAPPDLQRNAVQEVIKESAALLVDQQTVDAALLREKLFEHVHSHMACKAAVKAGDTLSLVQMQQLVNDLQQTANRHMCIHGRPTTWQIEHEQLAKKFGR